MPRALASSSRAFVVDPCAGGHRHHHHRRVAATPRASRLRTRALDGHFETLRFLTPADVKRVAETHGTPTYVYDEASLEAQAKTANAFPNAYGLTVRYAMKASPNAAILKTFKKAGLNIDASSGYECERAMLAGFAGEEISLSTQELPTFFPELVKRGVKVNACSLDQLDRFGAQFPGGEIGVRFNPGLGSGGTGKTNVGGPSSSFGIWYESLPKVKEIVEKHNLRVVRIHTHIGSGSDPAVWQKVSGMSLDLCREFPTVTTLNLGGGYKVGRMAYETSTDLQVVGAPVAQLIDEFEDRTGRALKLEVEPGTFLLANAASLVTRVQDLVSTGANGFEFLKLDSGMTELLRPSLYGSQHPAVLVPHTAGAARAADGRKYVAVGHCCESGDLVTPEPDEAETLGPRALGGEAQDGDLLVIEGAGAYCSSMCTKNYNSFPEAPEVMLDGNGAPHIIRKKQPVEEIWQNEVAYP